jgi:predicted phosphoribosyltransferase
MYFASRAQAGRMLATQLVPKYRYENCTIVALNDGGVLVAAQIAAQLHCSINLLLYEEIKLPLEPQAVSGIVQDGAYAYNSYYQPGELDEIMSEYYQYIEQEKLTKMHDMQRLLGSGGVIRKDLLSGHNIILVSDGLLSGFALDLAGQYLKPVKYQKLIVATPLASVQAVDRMHILADDLYCLNVIEDMMEVNHFYDDNEVPSHDKIIKIISDIILQWK